MKTKILFFSLIICHVFSGSLVSQNVAINNTGTPPDGSAILDVQSTTKGVLVPRLTSAQRMAVASPATGLLVFDVTTGSFWFKSSSTWIELVDTLNNVWKKNGTNAYLPTGNAGIGTSTPTYDLHIARTDPSIGFFDSNDNHFSGFITGDSADLLINAYRKSIFGSDEPGNVILQTGSSGILGNVAGHVGIGTSQPDVKLHVTGGSSTTGSSGGFLQLGLGSSSHLAFDNNGLQARTGNGVLTLPSLLSLQNSGGVIQMHSGTGAITFSGNSAGALNRSAISGSADLLPLAYGRVGTSGTVLSGTSNISVSKTGTGEYEITLTSESNLYSNQHRYTILATVQNWVSPKMISAEITDNNKIRVVIARPKVNFVNASGCGCDNQPLVSYITNVQFHEKEDNGFSILVYKD